MTPDTSAEPQKLPLLLRFGVPPRYLPAKPEDFPKQSFGVGDAGLFVTGPQGTGKTHFAVAAIRAFLQAEAAADGPSGKAWEIREYEAKAARFAVVPELLMDIRRAFKPNSTTGEEEIIAAYQRPRLLVLDDFGAEKQSDYTLQTLYVLVNWRLNHLLPTIVTSNLSLSEVAAFDPRLASRLASFRQVKLDGKDRRIGKGASA